MNESSRFDVRLARAGRLPCAAPGQTNEGALLSRGESSNDQATSRLLEQ